VIPVEHGRVNGSRRQMDGPSYFLTRDQTSIEYNTLPKKSLASAQDHAQHD
jgi:hypothetical protein